MRAVGVACLLTLLLPAAATAQSAAAKTDAGSKIAARGQDITKDQYIEQAKQRAAARFDKMDANHDGVLSADERRAARAKRKSQSQSQAQ
jgi:hypothetical protein